MTLISDVIWIIVFPMASCQVLGHFADFDRAVMQDCGMAFQQIGQCLQAVGIEAHEAAYAFGDICYVTAANGCWLSDGAANLEEATFFGNRKKMIPLFLGPARGT